MDWVSVSDRNVTVSCFRACHAVQRNRTYTYSEWALRILKLCIDVHDASVILGHTLSHWVSGSPSFRNIQDISSLKGGTTVLSRNLGNQSHRDAASYLRWRVTLYIQQFLLRNYNDLCNSHVPSCNFWQCVIVVRVRVKPATMWYKCTTIALAQPILWSGP
jgi:hypothetical protein